MRNFITLMVIGFFASSLALGQAQLSVIYSFAGSPGGASPADGLVFDKAGNLYGTTEAGGAYGWGSVFELSPTGNGTWTENTLYSFCAGGSPCDDGSQPLAALILDSAGDLYGTTSSGGDEPCPRQGAGCGTVFELSPPAVPGATWAYAVLYNFCVANQQNCLDGALPYEN